MNNEICEPESVAERIQFATEQVLKQDGVKKSDISIVGITGML